MAKDMTNLEVLSTRSGFNSAVRHIKKTISIIDSAGGNTNLGDLLYELGDEDLTGERVGLLLRMFLVDKLGYRTVSSNLATVVSDPSPLAGEFAKWKGVDLIVAYHHPDLGLLVANPKNAEELAGFGFLRKRELLVVYAGKGSSPADESCQKAARLAAALFEGTKAKAPAELLKGNFTVKKLKKNAAEEPPAKARKSAAPGPKKASKAATGGRGGKAAAPAQESARVAAPVVTSAAPAISKGPLRMTPMYSVAVTNELFHNGNVEAWKRIIASYNAKYPALQVYIYYEGEKILDINSLFKWGKVKHGSAIQFAVAGNDIKDVAKLQRYLVQGASNQFEAFLRGAVNNVLKLFG
ncbi:hypothetical protein AGMMS49546_11730 [Spirochaetia bacterium]|nr:hypothetical protein AGMMS49546_11730 [Spirochaetia bacterium]